MEKTLIGWVVIVPGHLDDIRTYFKSTQKDFMESCVMTYIMDGKKVVVEPEFGTPRKVLY